MKVLLYRPVLSQTLHDARGMGENERDLIEHSGINSKFVLDCAVFGVQAAVDLASLVHETCSTELSSVWFYSAFCKDDVKVPQAAPDANSWVDAFTAGSVILLAELSPAIVNIVTRSALEKAWDQCQESLNYLSSYSDTAGRCAQTLSMIRSKCLTITGRSTCSCALTLSNKLQTSRSKMTSHRTLVNQQTSARMKPAVIQIWRRKQAICRSRMTSSELLISTMILFLIRSGSILNSSSLLWSISIVYNPHP